MFGHGGYKGKQKEVIEAAIQGTRYAVISDLVDTLVRSRCLRRCTDRHGKGEGGDEAHM